MPEIIDAVFALAAPYAQERGCAVWDVEYVMEGGEWFLRVYLDKASGVSINDCEWVSRAMSDALDESEVIQTHIPGSYIFEVCSAGAERALTKPRHFMLCVGRTVDVAVRESADGRREFTGTLESCTQQDGPSAAITVDGRTFARENIAYVRLHTEYHFRTPQGGRGREKRRRKR